MKRQAFLFLIIKFRFGALPHYNIRDINEAFSFPPFRYAVHNFGVFMSWEAEIYKPFFIEALRCFFEQFYLFLIIFDESVVS